MDRKDLARAQRFFRSLAPLGEAARARRLEEICAEEPALGAEIEALLAAHDASGALDRSRSPRPGDGALEDQPQAAPTGPVVASDGATPGNRPARTLPRAFAELKRRHVFRIAAVYGVVGFGVMEAADVIFPAIPLPAWTLTLVVWLVLLGFPLALVLAWAFETTPSGVRRTPSVEPAVLDEIAAQPAGRRWAIGVAGLLGVVLIAAGAFWAFSRGESVPGEGTSVLPVGGPDAPLTVAVVLASSDAGGDDTDEGLAELLTRALGDVPGLRSAPANLVTRHWKARDPLLPDSAAALEVVRLVNAQAGVLLTVVTAGSRIRLRGTILPVGGAPVEGGAVQVDGEREDFFPLVDRFQVRLIGKLLPSESGYDASIASISTHSLPAMLEYLKGEGTLHRSGYAAAIPYFRRAVATDSTFALAWHRLGRAYGWTGNHDSAAIAGSRAEQFVSTLPERERLLVRVHANLAPEMIREVEDAVRRSPDDSELWYALGELYIHAGGTGGVSPRLADSAFARAGTIVPEEPENFFHRIDYALGFFHDRERAARLISEAKETTGEPLFETHRLLADLVFGGPPFERYAARIDDLPTDEFTGFPYPLAHPLATSARIFVDRRTADRAVFWGKLNSPFFSDIGVGRLSDALASGPERDSTLLALGSPPWTRTCYAYLLQLSGIDISGTPAAEWLRPSGPGADLPREALLCLGGHAVDQGRWSEAESWLSELRSRETGADSLAAPPAGASADALAAYLRWRRGNHEVMGLDRRLRLRMAVADSWPVRWWAARLLVEADRKEEALGVFESYWQPAWVPAFLERAELTEQLGRPEEARELYDVVLTMWADAEPAFQSLVERARSGRARVSAEP